MLRTGIHCPTVCCAILASSLGADGNTGHLKAPGSTELCGWSVTVPGGVRDYEGSRGLSPCIDPDQMIVIPCSKYSF